MSARTTLEYDVGLAWEGNRGSGTRDYEGYDRRFRVEVDGKPALAGSADPAFLGDPGLLNPEELLVAAVASCHMLVYLALCARAGVRVVSYSDRAHGTLALLPGGGGRFAEVTLRPRVEVAPESDRAAAAVLHDRAGELCFIAGSCSFPIRHRAEVEVASCAT
jgi:organic hydroperoxide reductase OsmC/OhrA